MLLLNSLNRFRREIGFELLGQDTPLLIFSAAGKLGVLKARLWPDLYSSHRRVCSSTYYSIRPPSKEYNNVVAYLAFERALSYPQQSRTWQGPCQVKRLDETEWSDWQKIAPS